MFHRKVEVLLQQTGASKYMFALDHKPEAKFAIYPEYKQTRKPMEFNPKPKLLEMIKNWNCYTLEAKGYEADDVIASYVAQYHDDEEIEVASTDKDMWQVLDHPNTKVYNFYSNSFVSTTHVEEAFKISEYKHIKLVKALFGDSGDNVKNVCLRQGVHLLPVIKKSDGSVDDLIEKIKSETLPKKCVEVFNDNMDKIRVNYELVKLKYNCRIEMKKYPLFQPQHIGLTATHGGQL